MKMSVKARSVSVLASVPLLLSAQPLRDGVPLRHWPAPLYWQPDLAESHPLAATPTQPSPLTFIAMTPCRVVDTRVGFGFSGAFGPPSLVGGMSRTFPLQSSSTCSIPAAAQAYSLNFTVVPPGPLGYLTAYPTGQPLPVLSTLNSPQGFIVANAAIVPAGTSGSIDIFVSNPTDLVIDINGYYAAQSAITLAPGSAGATALSFTGDAGTGVFSSGASTLNFATGGTNRVTIDSNGFLILNSTIPNLFPAVPSITIGNPSGLGSTAIFQGTDAVHMLEASWINPSFARVTTTGGQPLALQDEGLGSVGVGTEAPRDRLEVAGELRVADCVKNSGGTQIAGTCPSDERLKTNVEPFSPLLSQLVRLQPVHFDWRADEFPEYHFGSSRAFGLIAQQVEQEFPELVSQDKQGFKAVNYSELPLLLLQAIRELDAKNHMIQAQYHEQVEQNRNLESRVAALEALLSTKISESPR